MSNYEYKVLDLKVQQAHNSQEQLASEVQTIANRYAKEGWRLHTYRLTSFGRTPGFLGLAFENICHLVFERVRNGGTSNEAETPETTSESSGVSWEKYNELTRQRELAKKGRYTEVARNPLVRTSDDPLY